MESSEPKSIVQMRLPLVMKNQLEQMAKANRRSLSAQCQVLLEQFMPDPLAQPQERDQ